MKYKIIRLFFNSRRRYTLQRGLTLEEAQAHCNDPETSSNTCLKAVNIRRTRKQGPWFDAYDYE